MSRKTYVISFDVEMGEVDGDSPLWWSQYLPNAIFVGRVQIGKRGRRDGAIRGID